MAQPPPYNRQASFTNLQAVDPDGQPPGNTMDAEFNAVKTTLDATLANLKLIQNDDTTLGNATVGPAQLSPSLTLGFTPPAAWVTPHAYTASPASTVLQGTGMYICLVSHTSGAFAADLAAGKWLLIFDLSTLTFGTAAQISAVAHGSNVTANVQTSLNNLDDNKAALSHTHTAVQISDSTVVGRAMLTAASVPAQQALLGLGSLAFLSSVPATTAIPGQLAFTGNVSSGLLAASQNDLTPTGWATNSVLRLASSSAVSITGFGATTDGDVKFVQNVGAFGITLVGGSILSAAANRIVLSRPMLIPPGQSVTLQYDGGSSLWRVLSQINTNPPVGAFKNLRVGNVANYLGDSAPGTPNNQAYIKFDEIVLEDGFSNTWWVPSGALTVDGTVQNAPNGTDAAVSIGGSIWYSLWVIGNPTTNTIAGLISSQVTSPSLPSGYTFKARAGWMRTDGSSHFLRTLQYGRKARYVNVASLPNMATGNSATWTAVAVANFVPPTATSIIVHLQSYNAAAGIGAAPNNTYTDLTTAPLSNQHGMNGIAEFLLESSNIYYGSAAGAGPGLNCAGWEDS